jgi:hypothetical protein
MLDEDGDVLHGRPELRWKAVDRVAHEPLKFLGSDIDH